jgi:hypothetical protein
MKFIAFAVVIIGYAALYAGGSNLVTGGKGWGFMQSLLNNGSGNQDLTGVSGVMSGGGSNNPAGALAGSALKSSQNLSGQLIGPKSTNAKKGGVFDIKNPLGSLKNFILGSGGGVSGSGAFGSILKSLGL